MSQFSAIWDTGATNSAISQKVVDTCGLKPFTLAKVDSAHGSELRPVFSVNIGIYQGPTITDVAVTLADLVGSDALIGMDIITLGDFVITNQRGNTTFSFRIPSQHTIDYVAETKVIRSPWGLGPPGGQGAQRSGHKRRK